MTTTDMYLNERLDHLGIVAGVCQEIGLAAWLDGQEPSNRKPAECDSDDPQWLRMKPPAIGFLTVIHYLLGI